MKTKAIRYYFLPATGPGRKAGSRRAASRSKTTDSIGSLLTKGSFSSKRQYSSIVHALVSVARGNAAAGRSSMHSAEMVGISKGLPLTEKTDWGGVSMKYVDVEGDRIRKLLVINNGGVLGFEYHKRKLERPKVLEGCCLMLYSNHKARGWGKGQIRWKVAQPGDRFEFLPGDEHGMVALSDSVIEETSTNHLDDIEYIYRISQPSRKI